MTNKKYSADWEKDTTVLIFETAESLIQSTQASNEAKYNAYRLISLIIWFNKYLYPYFSRLLALIEYGADHPYGSIRTTVWHMAGDTHILMDPLFWKHSVTKNMKERRKIGYEWYAMLLEKHDEYEKVYERELDEEDLTKTYGYTPSSVDTTDKILKSYRNILWNITRGSWLKDHLEEHDLPYYMDSWLLRFENNPHTTELKEYFSGRIDQKVMDGFFAILDGDRFPLSIPFLMRNITQKAPNSLTKEYIVWLATDGTLEALTTLEELIQTPKLSHEMQEWIKMGIFFAKEIAFSKEDEDDFLGTTMIFSPLGIYGGYPRYSIGLEITHWEIFQKKSDRENINAYYILSNIPARIESIESHQHYARVSIGISHDIAVEEVIESLLSYFNTGTKCVKHKYLISNTEIPPWKDIKQELDKMQGKNEQ